MVTKVKGIHRSHPFDRRDVHAIDQVVEVCSWDVFGLLDLRGSEMLGMDTSDREENTMSDDSVIYAYCVLRL